MRVEHSHAPHFASAERKTMIDISKPIADTRASLALTRATLARIDRKWRARRADGTVVAHASIVVVLGNEVTK